MTLTSPAPRPPGPEPADVGATGAEPTRLRIREPADLVTLVPYLLSFQPEESVVAVYLGEGRIALTARLDLPSAELPADPAHELELALAEELLRLGEHVHADDLVLIGYGERPGGRAVLERLTRRCGPVVLESLWVSAGRWWSLTCRQECCPPKGRPYEPSSHPLAAEAVLAGMSAAVSREALADLAAGPSADQHDRLQAVATRLRGTAERTGRRARQRRMDRLVSAALEAGRAPTEREALTLAVLALDVMVRDIALARMSRADAHDHVSMWSGVVRHCPDDVAAAPLCLLGIAGWLTGNGALLNCCLERLDGLGQDYSLAEICRDISERALPPSTWDALADGLRADPDLWA